MVGILLISHSAQVAAGVLEIARQMVGDEVPIAISGGNKAGGIGTDPDAITIALTSLLNPDGVLVLADLGSAVMSAELVIENIASDHQVVIANAPLVEGAVLAAVEAAMGKNLDQVLIAAESAYKMRKVERGDQSW